MSDVEHGSGERGREEDGPERDKPRMFEGDSDERSYGADGGASASGLGVGEADEDSY